MGRDRKSDGNKQKDAAKKPLKLKLNKETLRMLNRDELALIAGGMSPHTCPSNGEGPC